MIKMALPKGRLLEGVSNYLTRAGINLYFNNSRDYKPRVSDSTLKAKLVKPRAIPQLVALGNYDVGFCGLDLLVDSEYENAKPIFDLGLNKVKLIVAVPRDKANLLSNPPKRPLLIATEYEKIADRWALKNNLAHITIQTYGSTEGYAPDDADIVFDCMETGATLAANGLIVLEKIMDSSTYLIANISSLETKADEINRFKGLLKKVKESEI